MTTPKQPKRNQPAQMDDLAQIRADLEQCFVGVFPATEGVAIDEQSVIANDTSVAVAWTYSGIDSEGVLDLPPTMRPVTVTGLTIYRRDAELFERHIDWLGAFVQLGYSLRTGRTVTAPSSPDGPAEPSGIAPRQSKPKRERTPSVTKSRNRSS
jgi:hypothetical protein